MTCVAIRTTSWRPFRRAPPGIGAILEGCGNNRLSRALITALCACFDGPGSAERPLGGGTLLGDLDLAGAALAPKRCAELCAEVVLSFSRPTGMCPACCGIGMQVPTFRVRA